MDKSLANAFASAAHHFRLCEEAMPGIVASALETIPLGVLLTIGYHESRFSDPPPAAPSGRAPSIEEACGTYQVKPKYAGLAGEAAEEVVRLVAGGGPSAHALSLSLIMDWVAIREDRLGAPMTWGEADWLRYTGGARSAERRLQTLAKIDAHFFEYARIAGFDLAGSGPAATIEETGPTPGARAQEIKTPASSGAHHHGLERGKALSLINSVSVDYGAKISPLKGWWATAFDPQMNNGDVPVDRRTDASNAAAPIILGTVRDIVRDLSGVDLEAETIAGRLRLRGVVRDPKNNERRGGKPGSAHLYAWNRSTFGAFDIDPVRSSERDLTARIWAALKDAGRERVTEVARAHGAPGLGAMRYNRGELHLDIRQHTQLGW